MHSLNAVSKYRNEITNLESWGVLPGVSLDLGPQAHLPQGAGKAFYTENRACEGTRKVWCGRV